MMLRNFALRLRINTVCKRSIGLTVAKLHANTNAQSVRVRFAPSPTGSLHIGGVRTALFNWMLARKKEGGIFIVRIEDTDEARSTRASEQSILADLRWMGLHWDEGPLVDGPYSPYRQSERMDFYEASVNKLLAEGKAYRCFCTEEELLQRKEERVNAAIAAAIKSGTSPDEVRRLDAEGAFSKYDGAWRDAKPTDVAAKLASNMPYTVRFKVPAGKVVSINDVVRGVVSWDASGPSFSDFIIQRSNGSPVYNFCVAVDDAAMKITHVIRAEEHLTNTAKQVMILEALGYAIPTYAHCSLILGTDRQKLSKRHGAVSVQQYGEQGFLPSAIMNYLALLGWNSGTPKEVYLPDELVQAFDIHRIVKGAAVFDLDKLRWINSQHLKLMPRDTLNHLVKDSFLKSGINSALSERSALGSGSSASLSLGSALRDSDELAVFVNQAVSIAFKDMQVVTDARSIVEKCLDFRLGVELNKASAAPSDTVLRIIANSNFSRVVNKLVQDYDNDKMPLPVSGATAYPQTWNAYVKALGVALQLKGKDLYHPVRFALTGQESGPDVGEQILLWQTASGVVPGAMTLRDRVAVLRNIELQGLDIATAQGAS